MNRLIVLTEGSPLGPVGISKFDAYETWRELQRLVCKIRNLAIGEERYRSLTVLSDDHRYDGVFIGTREMDVFGGAEIGTLHIYDGYWDYRMPKDFESVTYMDKIEWLAHILFEEALIHADMDTYQSLHSHENL